MYMNCRRGKTADISAAEFTTELFRYGPRRVRSVRSHLFDARHSHQHPLNRDAPFIESIPKESLEFTLQSTRSAVLRVGLRDTE